MGELVRKEACPSCRENGNDTSGDNLAVYDDDSTYCFSCGHTDQPGRDSTATVGHKWQIPGKYKDLVRRGISKKTCEHYSYQIGSYKGEACHIENYFSDAQVVAQKIRCKSKKFVALGDIKQSLLFGQHLYQPSNNTFCVVTEGAIDAMSVAEVCGCRYPVVSLKNGAGSARKELSEQLEWLEGFKHVVLCLDNDRPGQDAIDKCEDLIENCRVAKLPLKDANEMLLAGRSGELRSAIFNAKSITPATLLSVDDVLKEGITKPTMGIKTGIDLIDTKAYGLHSGIYIVCAGSGTGKTIVVRDILGYIMTTTDTKCVLLSFEQTASDSLLRLAGYTAQRVLHTPDVEIDQAEIEKYLQPFKDKLYIHNNKDLPSADELGSKIRYYVKSTGCKVVVLDNLTALTAGLTEERKGIDQLMSVLGGLSVELNVTLILVSHLSKPEAGKSYEEGRQVTAAALRGSQSLQFWSSLIFSVERNKLSEDPVERNKVTIRVLKDRLTGQSEGCTEQLIYDTESGRLKPGEHNDNQFINETEVI